MSSATGQTDPTSSIRARRSAQPTGRGFEVSSVRMASISWVMSLSWSGQLVKMTAGCAMNLGPAAIDETTIDASIASPLISDQPMKAAP
jgi:hypothetical protein